MVVAMDAILEIDQEITDQIMTVLVVSYSHLS